jgi:hypothetical protein
MMRIGQRILCGMVAAATLTLLGCALLLQLEDGRPGLILPSAYERDGMAFTYPGNWSIVHDGPLPRIAGTRAVQVVGSSSSTLFTIAEYRGEERPTLEEVVESIESKRDAEEPIYAEILGGPRWGIAFEYGRSLLIIGVVVRAEVYEVDLEDRRLFLAMRAAVDDWAIVQPGFKAIRSSLELRDAETIPRN